jgi:trigger factor
MERNVQAKIIEREAVSARIEVQVPADEVQKAYAGIYRSLAQQVRVDGFRPGKAPRRVLEARIGKESIDEEVREALIKHFYPPAAHDLGLNPVHATVDAGQPVEGEAFTFLVALELYPEVALADMDEIVIDTEVPALSDAQLSETIEAIRRDRATLVPVDRPVEPGDYLSVESLSEGGESSGNTMPLDLENIDDDLAEGFIGKEIGDLVELKIPHNHPLGEGDPEEHVTVLKVRVLDVKGKEKPEVDDDLAKTLGFASWQEAETNIRKNLQDRLDAQGFEEQQEEFVGKLVETSEVALPKSLVSRQQDALRARFDEDLKRRGASLETYLDSLEAEQQQALEAELLENAKRQVKRDLVLERLLETRKPALSEADFRRALEALAESRRVNLVQLRKELGEAGLSNYRYLLMRESAVRDAVKERLQGTAAAEPLEEEGGATPANEA